MNNSIENILEYWFGTFPDAYRSDPAKSEMWFKNGAAYDQEIFITFGGIYDKAINHQLDHWQDMPRGRLALIIVLDQFSRHIHRGYIEAFAQDEKSQQLCLDGIGAGDDLNLHPIERSFFYLPLQHAENIERQNLSIEAYFRLAQDVPESFRQNYMLNLDFAQKHHYVIERFGHFPDLNEILGRSSTDEELAFIKNGEYSFL